MFARPWPDPPAPTVWVVDVTGPALVLGSTQPESTVDRARAAAAGVAVVRRRSGGGAVLVGPGSPVWVDVLVPAGDPLWQADVARAFAWLGQAWAGALAGAGVRGARAHGGALLTSPWSSRVCFAGLGPGEVTVEGAKVVGMSQRRTRAAALFQCAVLLAWDPARLVDLLALDDRGRAAAVADLAGVARGVDVDADALVAGLLERLP